MPRGRAPTYDAQREAILAGAAKLFAERGYSDVSMNEVARACGVSKASLYHYVDDKYRLLVEIAEGHVDRLRALIRRIVAEYAQAQHAHRVLTEDVKFLADDDRDRVLGKQRTVVAVFARVVALLRPKL